MTTTTISSPTAIDPADKSMDDIVALCKRRGFVFPASEIYGGINGFWDYGPLGVTLKNTLRDRWWRDMVDAPPIGPDGEPVSIVGVDTSIIQNPKVWEASGHIGGFNDPMVDDTETKQRFRADHLFGLFSTDPNASSLIPVATVVASSHAEVIEALRDKSTRKRLGIRDFTESASGPDMCQVDLGRGMTLVSVDSVPYSTLDTLFASVPSPFTGKTGTLTEPRQFNLMFPTYVGAVFDEDNKAYLRPETAQGIFLNFKNVFDTMRIKVPFGIAQVGKSFRNEVTPRNFIFRSREFEQMEMEWFCHPDDSQKWYDFWVDARFNWWKSLGISDANLIRRDHDADELAHYSTACADVEYKYPFTAPGFGELEGIAHRGCYDLTKHQEHSKQKLTYFDQERNEHYLPHVIEPAAGLTRGLLVLLCEAYTPTPERKGSKCIMSFQPDLAPIQAAVFPLVAKDGMPEKAAALYEDLRKTWRVQYDVKQSIGKRYARMDEVGTPFCFTIDSETLERDVVTVRYRDTGEQEQLSIDKVRPFLAERIGQ